MYNLSDLQIAKIEAFCADKEMYDAVKRVILAGIYEHGTIQAGYEPNPLENAAFNLASLAISNPIPDEALGQNIRSMWAGVNSMKNAFDKLDTIKSKQDDSVESPYNVAE
jgi:hypothetical protein